MTLNTIVAKKQSGAHLRLLELCYRYAYLLGRQKAGLELSMEEGEELASLSHLFEGDPERRRRGHRRFPMLLHAVVKTPKGAWCQGRVLNMSGNGMVLSMSHDVPDGATIQVRLGRPGEVEYLFTCTVVRTVADAAGEPSGCGLSFCCVPLEMRRAA